MTNHTLNKPLLYTAPNGDGNVRADVFIEGETVLHYFAE
jgi:hypothetical protein